MSDVTGSCCKLQKRYNSLPDQSPALTDTAASRRFGLRLRVADCKWIFDNCEEGTLVEFYSSSIPSPFAKPELEKISDNVECRNWDPTDDVPENPWKKYINE